MSSPSPSRSTTEPAWVRWTLITIALGFLALFLVLPLVAVFIEALAKGFGAYFASFNNADARHALKLTLIVTVVAVVANSIFGLLAAWALTKFEFWGKSVVLTLIDLPFAVSPVISGLIFVLLFGMQGLLGEWMMENNLPPIVFAVPGIILATMFITFPFVARELIPIMQSQGTEEEEAARVLGASGWKTFWYVTLPNVKWGLLYGVILCSARAMGEFGAVSVVSGHIRGQTNTLPLHIEIAYNEYQFVAAFACASVLTLLALVTLVAKSIVEWRIQQNMERAAQSTGTA